MEEELICFHHMFRSTVGNHHFDGGGGGKPRKTPSKELGRIVGLEKPLIRMHLSGCPCLLVNVTWPSLDDFKHKTGGASVRCSHEDGVPYDRCGFQQVKGYMF